MSIKVALPLDWQPGDKVIEAAPTTLEGLAERKADKDLELVDWYLAKNHSNGFVEKIKKKLIKIYHLRPRL